MVVERKQRKPVIRQDNSGKAANGMVFQGSRFSPISDLEAVVTDAQQPLSTPLADVPIHQSKASSSHYPSLDQSKHTAVVMNENLNPNVGNLSRDSIPDRTSPLGEPPDKHAHPSQLPAPRILVDTSQ
ncbi:hypothetical protein V6N13_083376 [Hibiscus sabdariffa]